MTRDEFIKRLENGLTGVSREDQENAVQYYSEYFDDAGPERAAEVLAELGDPDKLAADIKAASETKRETKASHSLKTDPSSPGASNDYGEQPKVAEQPHTENTDKRRQFPGGYIPTHYESQAHSHPYAREPEQYDSDNYFNGNTGRKALFIVLLVLLSPAILGIGVAGLMLLLVPFIMAIAFGFSTAVVIIMGFLLINASVANGLLILGIALLLLAVTLLLVYAGVRLFGAAVPVVIRTCQTAYYRFIGMEGGYAQ